MFYPAAQLEAGLVCALWKGQDNAARSAAAGSQEMKTMGEMKYIMMSNNDGLLDLYAAAGFISRDRHKPDG